ncbi:ACT domain-containing protein [Almyronema epifaneia]|uniref:ACT domain-containing protein n=1 Tax=Almyronema epifaneia S1 TaxID=2991925 RepID=A0ABW6IJ57_9CYAN
MTLTLTLILLPETFAICRLAPEAPLPYWATGGSLFSITRTAEELSIVCADRRIPETVICDRPWQALKVDGPLDFALIGILASLATPLAEAGISIFAISTYDTDYLLVKQAQVKAAIAVLKQQGHRLVSLGHPDEGLSP